LTLQLICVILAGAVLGARLGAASQALYLGVGMLGAPIFAAGGGLPYLLGPTGGYLIAFPIAAYVVGSIVGRSRSIAVLTAALVGGVLTVHAGGAAWLAISTGDVRLALEYGVGPFLLMDVVKIALALLIALRVRPRALELF
jgi:biotin transport system substrate-specific component